mgnify:CR=1 FL=1
MNREDQTEAPNEEIAGAPTLDSDEASRALARVQQVLDSDEDRARALEKAREKAEKAARAKSGVSEKPDEDDKDDEARPLTPEAAQQLRDILEPLHPADIAWVLEALPLDALQGLCDRIGPDVFDVLEYRAAVARRNAPGGTGPLSVVRQLEKMKAWLHETK